MVNYLNEEPRKEEDAIVFEKQRNTFSYLHIARPQGRFRAPDPGGDNVA